MEKNIENIICINKDIFNKLLLLTNTSSDVSLDENDTYYLIEKKIYNEVVNKFNKLLRFKEKESFINIKGASLLKYNELKNKSMSIKYNDIRNKYNMIKAPKIDEEDLLNTEIMLFEEIDNIKKIPSIVEKIKKEISEVKRDNISDNIKSIEVKFNKLVYDGALYNDYLLIKEELDLIIKSTYVNNINRSTTDNKDVYLVKQGDKFSILNTSNIDKFEYGYIYSPDSIIEVKNKNNDYFTSFNNADFNSCEIKVRDEKPIAIYAVTYGEMSINQNYVKAQNVLTRKNLPFIEFDITKMMNPANYSIKGFIDNLLADKGVEISNKTDEFYEKFKHFYTSFMKIKLNKYDEGNVINLFDFYFNAIFSQKYINLDKVFDEHYTPLIVKTILENNIYIDFNIFAKDRINKTVLKKFYETLYPYINNELLNKAYPGIDDILQTLSISSEDTISEIIDIINNSSCKDSWLISNLIKQKSKVNYEVKDNRLSEIKEEKKQVKALVSLLKSKDEVYTR